MGADTHGPGRGTIVFDKMWEREVRQERAREMPKEVQIEEENEAGPHSPVQDTVG